MLTYLVRFCQFDGYQVDLPSSQTYNDERITLLAFQEIEMIHKVNTVTSGDCWNSSVFVSRQYQLGDLRYTFKNIFGWCYLGKDEENIWCKISSSETYWSDCWSGDV